ncbi:MAG: zinc ribbon domain-containing protein [Thermodesulfobacteriota bacterium]
MPVYEYECESCGQQFEYMIFTSSDPEPQCPKCAAGKVKRMISSGNLRNSPLTSGYGGFPTKKY